jgi:hypothetical protein
MSNDPNFIDWQGRKAESIFWSRAIATASLIIICTSLIGIGLYSFLK